MRAVCKCSRQTDKIQSRVRFKSQPGGCLGGEDVARKATKTLRKEKHMLSGSPAESYLPSQAL